MKRALLTFLAAALVSNPALAQTHVYPPLPASAAEFTAHVADTDGAHAASAISVATIIGLVATNVQAAIAELHSGLGSLTSFVASLTGTTAAGWTVNVDAAGMLPEAASIVIRASTGAAVVPWTLSATAGGLVALWPDVTGASLGGTLILGPPGDFLASGDDVDQTLLLRGHKAGDAVDAPTTASIAIDASAGTLILTPPSGGSTSISAGNVTLAALATVDGRDVSVDGAALDSLLDRREYMPVGMSAVGTTSNATVSLPAWDATDRLPCVTITATGADASAELGWSLVVPAGWSDWQATAIRVWADWSLTDDGQAVEVTCKDTAGATIVDAEGIPATDVAGWRDITTVDPGTYAVGGHLSCTATVIVSASETARVCGILWQWTQE